MILKKLLSIKRELKQNGNNIEFLKEQLSPIENNK